MNKRNNKETLPVTVGPNTNDPIWRLGQEVVALVQAYINDVDVKRDQNGKCLLPF